MGLGLGITVVVDLSIWLVIPTRQHWNSFALQCTHTALVCENLSSHLFVDNIGDILGYRSSLSLPVIESGGRVGSVAFNHFLLYD